MPQLFALLVGIADYHPSSGVTPLTGCLNDVNNVEAYLLQRFAPGTAMIEKLVNDKASRQAVIDTFISHLIKNGQIKENDIVLFYYSGHGSHAASNPAFYSSDSEAQDETLVLYDSRCEGNFDLADKELRLLLSSIPAKANIVVIMDSCHSGSATRNVDDLDAILLGKPRHQPARARNAPRNLSEYLTIDGKGYEMLLDAEGNVTLPEAKYIALAACERREVAYESNTSPEGMFTGMLLRALGSGDANLTYSRLHEYLYTLLKRRARQQTPQLEVYNGYNPDLVFLSNDIHRGKAEYLVVREPDGLYTINCGALHGLRNDPRSIRAVSVKVYDKDKPNDAGIMGKISSVGLDKSELSVPKLGPKIYMGSVVNLAPAICILVNGTEQQIKEWKDLTNISAVEALAFTYDPNEQAYDYILSFRDESIILSRKENDVLVHGVKNILKAGMHYMLACCDQLGRWHMLLDLQNSAITEREYNQKFKTRFGIELQTGIDGDWQLQDAEDMVLYLKETTDKIPFRIHLSTQSPGGWYCAVFHLSRKFGIKKNTLNIEQSILKKDQPLDVLNSIKKFSIKDDSDEVIDRFKLIISTEPFKDYLVPDLVDLEPVIVEGPERGFNTRDIDDNPIDQNWFAKTITVKIVRQSGKIDDLHTYENGKLTIHPHESLTATASASPIISNAKSTHSSLQLQELVNFYGYSFIDINSNKKSAEPPSSVIWLDAIDGAADLDQQPLRVSLKELQKDGEELVALTMQDGIVQIAGLGIYNETGGYDFDIRVLPEDNSRKKSLLRAAWFCFVKVVLRQDPSMLRVVKFENGKAGYGKSGVDEAVEKSHRTALVIHGIIGNTKGMAESMEFLLKEGYYDCMLAFDYENLNTKIGEIAETLHKKLQDAGISGNKPIDIFVHSMGGLVARHMIEHIKGAHKLVQNLYMFGTPNAGSAFGKIPKLRDWTVGILTLACNYGRAWLGTIGPVLAGVNAVLGGTVVATNTLAEMADDSDFYKILNNPEWEIDTHYHIMAGNVLIFKPGDDDGRFARVMEKIKKQVGEWAYGNADNDIAVAVKSIKSAPLKNIKTVKDLACHHLNYFEVSESLNYFKQLIRNNNGN